MLELIALLGILTVSILTVFTMGVFSTKVARQSERRAVAMSLARQKLDDIAAIRQSNRQVGVEIPFTIPSASAAQFPKGTILSGTYSVQPLSTSKNLEQITVTITWQNAIRNSTPSSVTLVKLVVSPDNLYDTPYDGTTPLDWDTIKYVPPPPPPPSSTAGGTTSTGGTPPPDPTTGGSTSTGGTTGGTTGTSTGGGAGGFLGMTGVYGSKWK
jgi:hypothetical protein